MEIEIDMQWKYFLWAVLVGWVLGVVYDLLRLRRKIKSSNDFWINIEDIGFMVIAGVSLFLTAHFKNDGLLRWHGFIGEGLGFVCYKLIMGDNIVSAAYIAIRLIKKFIMIPIGFVVGILKRPAVFVCLKMRRVYNYVLKTIKVWRKKAENRLKNTKNAIKKK